MSAETHSYPDVFGYITDAERITVGVVQVALATRPRAVKAGREFEVILLIQNTADCPVDVSVKLQLPQKDQEGKKGRFITNKERLVVGVAPAEVGYVTLPMSILPDTAIGTDYMIGMSVSAKALEKGERVRPSAGGLPFRPETVTEESREEIEGLRKLRFSTRKRGLLRSLTLETPVDVIQGKLGKTSDLEPGWTSLWTLEVQQDDMLLLDKFGQLMRQKVLPGLDKEKLFEPLVKKTYFRFKKGGYQLTKPETFTIVRLLLTILQYGAGHTGSVTAGKYDVNGVLRTRARDRQQMEKRRLIDEEMPVPELPHWAHGYLRLIARDERVARVPTKVIPELLYDDLLRDALEYSFRIVERDSGENLGTEDEMDSFADLIMNKLDEGSLDFSHTYLPLIMGGVIVTDQALLSEERLGDVMKSIRFIVDEREDERDEDNSPVFDMANDIMQITLKKYGYLDNR